MGYHWNCPNEPVLMAGTNPLLTDFGVYHRLERCVAESNLIHPTHSSFLNALNGKEAACHELGLTLKIDGK